MPILDKAKNQEPEILDAETLAALEEGLKMADVDPRRWTPEQVRNDARSITKQWRKKITYQAKA